MKKFVYDDIPLFHNVEFKVIGGAKPEVLFLNMNDEEVERHSLEGRSRVECNQLLLDRGFEKKKQEAPQEEEGLFADEKVEL